MELYSLILNISILNLESYRACLSEIVRRRQYGALFSQKMECMAEEIANMREKELEIRNQFLSQYGQHLPRDFVPGLAEKPSHCEFRVRPFDLVGACFVIIHIIV